MRFIGRPTDLVVFRGMDDKEIEEIVFVGVKAGDAELEPVERSLRQAIWAGRVSWEEWRGPKEG